MINDKALDPRALARGNSSTGLTIWELFNRPLNSFGDYMPMLRQSLALKTDVKEEADAYILSADLPGVMREDIKLTFEDGVLSLSVTRKAEEEEQQGQYLVRERSAGTAERRFAFPDVDDAAIEAKLQDGVLTLRLPKKSKPGRQSIAVK